ncbi:hypothetical protein J4E91_007709 [Alternaria rosae]|uniref:uncharacterized protein n=1 Tax=Alternaria rosae TaxID=1187941 RepID=UPI001E8D222C|nr:uncharacterized protein BKA58DRAFT_387804 [Alternaria rosae]KAH6866337.1 hypothetical protein BKA58DRAFT_387804 [Alternaria rosae]KAI4945796.1 hypothetical protein J4E91_007709 [Alternaria rosae]
MDNRAIRLPPTTRRNIFAAHTTQQQQTQSQQPPARRQNQAAPSIRPDSREIEQDIFMQPTQDEFVERDDIGEYVVKAPAPVYREMGVGSEGDEEGEQENEMIQLYGKTNAQWDAVVVEEEIRAALKSSLKKKVASLEDDRWMFEGEGEGRK